MAIKWKSPRSILCIFYLVLSLLALSIAASFFYLQTQAYGNHLDYTRTSWFSSDARSIVNLIRSEYNSHQAEYQRETVTPNVNFLSPSEYGDLEFILYDSRTQATITNRGDDQDISSLHRNYILGKGVRALAYWESDPDNVFREPVETLYSNGRVSSQRRNVEREQAALQQLGMLSTEASSLADTTSVILFFPTTVHNIPCLTYSSGTFVYRWSVFFAFLAISIYLAAVAVLLLFWRPRRPMPRVLRALGRIPADLYLLAAAGLLVLFWKTGDGYSIPSMAPAAIWCASPACLFVLASVLSIRRADFEPDRAFYLLRLKKRLSERLYGKPLRIRNRLVMGSLLALGVLPIGLSGAIMAYPISEHGTSFLTSADMVPSLALLLLGILALFICCRAWGRQTRQLSAIETQIERIRNGELDAGTTLSPTDALYGIASGLDDMQSAVTQAVNRQLASEKMKMELITNVSHDLKTPLTSIINYIGLLREEPGLPDAARDYVEVAQHKAERLKTLIQDLFDISKANSGNIELHLTQIGLCDLLRQTLGELEDQTARASIRLKAAIPTEQIYVMGDGGKLHRVFENLLTNILKYSMPGTRAYITLEVREQTARITFKNISRDEIPYSPEELTERFVRGDASRGTEGSGLGLAIAKSFAELMGGSLELSVDGDLFKVSVSLPNCKTDPLPPV